MVVCKLVDIVCNCVYVYIVRTMWKKNWTMSRRSTHSTTQLQWNIEWDGWPKTEGNWSNESEKKHNVFLPCLFPLLFFFHVYCYSVFMHIMYQVVFLFCNFEQRITSRWKIYMMEKQKKKKIAAREINK